jgi:hypothetical protein
MKSSPEVLALTDPAGSHVMTVFRLIDFEPLGYLKAFDPEAHAGLGEARFTDNKAEALRFKDAPAAFSCWTLVPKSRPERSDGKPNKPLTAYTIEVAPYASAP